MLFIYNTLYTHPCGIVCDMSNNHEIITCSCVCVCVCVVIGSSLRYNSVRSKYTHGVCRVTVLHKKKKIRIFRRIVSQLYTSCLPTYSKLYGKQKEFSTTVVSQWAGNKWTSISKHVG